MFRVALSKIMQIKTNESKKNQPEMFNEISCSVFCINLLECLFHLYSVS